MAICEKKLIEELSKNSVFEKVTVGEETVYDIINRQPKVNEWIPVSERLPEEFVNVLICTDSGTFDVACLGYSYLDICNIWKPVGGGYRKQENVIAWMRLPAPYDMRKKVE